MDAIDLLEKQHRSVEELFDRFGETEDPKERLQLFERIADALAVHAEIEEQVFYPATKGSRTESDLREAVEEHLQMKRLIADLLELSPEDPQFEAKMTVLEEEVSHHVEEEEAELFEKARRMLDSEDLDQIADEMQALADQLREEGTPRRRVPEHIDEAASID